MLNVVTDEQLSAYQGMVSQLARRYHGLFGAEYDDLFQEGWEQCFDALRNSQFPSKELVAKRMTRWVNRCANHWMSMEKTDEENSLLS